MKDHEVRIRVAVPFQRMTPDLRNLIRDHVERLQVALCALGHSVNAEVHEVRRDPDLDLDVTFAKWYV